MKNLLILLLVVGFVLGCSENKSNSSIDSDSEPVLTQRYQEALDLLLNTDTFAGTRVGFAGSVPRQVPAFQTLLEHKDADELFGKIQKEAALEGQLYGLCGLYLTAKESFDEEIEQYQKSTDSVLTFFGCIMSKQPVTDLLPQIIDGTWSEAYRDCE